MVGINGMTLRLISLMALAGLLVAGTAYATPSTCSVMGVVNDGAGNPVANATVYFNSMNTQVVNSTTVAPITKAATTDANGNISTIALIQGLFVQITICQAQGGGCTAPVTGFVPLASTVTFANLLSGTATFSGSTLTGNLNASGFRILNVGANTTANDALSQGQSHLNDLAAATGNYAMSSNKITGLAAGSGSGDAMAFGLNHLNDLATATGNYAMDTHRITQLQGPGASGDALSEGSIIGAVTPAAGTFTLLTSTQQIQTAENDMVESGGGTLTPNLALGADQAINITDNSAFTIANPTNSSPARDFLWWIRIANTSGGAAGAITLGAAYRSDTSWGAPANGKTRICQVKTTINFASALVHYIGPCTGDETN